MNENIVQCRVTYEAVGWHGGVREEKDDALRKVYKAIRKLQCSGIVILGTEAGDTYNIHPSRGTIILGYSGNEKEGQEELLRKIRDVLDECKKTDAGMDYQLELI